MQHRPSIIAIASLVGAFLAAVAASTLARAAEPRTALVIGNGAYSGSPLRNPRNDASAIAGVLKAAGFDVTVRTDADRRSMRDAIRDFGASLRSKGGVGLFYFAGHGVQAAGENYLLPVGEEIADENDLKRGAVTAAEAVDAMAAASNGLNIVILDACRDNPLARGGTRGLSRIDSNANLFVSFSTSPGAVALDGDGANSPYTKHLATAIGSADLNLEETFKRTLKGVYQETRGGQTPWISSSFFGDFVFRPTSPTAPATAPPSAIAPPPPPAWTPPQRQDTPRLTTAAAAAASLAGVYRAEGRNPDKSRYRGMTAIVPDGEELRFTWWIGKDVFTGRGHFAGRMLVVNWGQKHPVIYTFAGGEALDGEWADGRATERLRVFAGASQPPQRPIEGRYQAIGRNADGGSYSGSVAIDRLGERYRLKWTVGSSSYSGVGVIEHNLLVVDWGSATPVVYALSSDGMLKGLWDGGKGEETLIPD